MVKEVPDLMSEIDMRSTTPRAEFNVNRPAALVVLEDSGPAE
jgi:hypothetical protein